MINDTGEVRKANGDVEVREFAPDDFGGSITNPLCCDLARECYFLVRREGVKRDVKTTESAYWFLVLDYNLGNYEFGGIFARRQAHYRLSYATMKKV